jgi:hypothetical protein
MASGKRFVSRSMAARAMLTAIKYSSETKNSSAAMSWGAVDAPSIAGAFSSANPTKASAVASSIAG